MQIELAHLQFVDLLSISDNRRPKRPHPYYTFAGINENKSRFLKLNRDLLYDRPLNCLGWRCGYSMHTALSTDCAFFHHQKSGIQKGSAVS